MLFTLVIWVFGALSLILAVLFYVFFLWHYIPNKDGGLSAYCENKTNKRLASIVSVKVNKAIEEEERKRRKADAKALKNGERPAFGRQATLPTLFDAKDSSDGDKLPKMPMLNRNDTMATLPIYSSRPGTPSGSNSQPRVPAFELEQLDNKRPTPSRNGTANSFGSNAPLMSNASDMGYGRSESPAPSLPPLDRNGFPAPQRTTTANSQNGQWNRGPVRPLNGMVDRGYTASPASYDYPPPSSHVSNHSQESMDNYGRPLLRGGDRSNTPTGAPPSMGRRTPFDPNVVGRNSPAPYPPSDYGRNSPAPYSGGPSPITSSSTGGYQAYNPNFRSASAANSRPPNPQPSRNMTDPRMESRGPPQESADYFGNGVAPSRPGTAQGTPYIPRLASPGAYNGGNTPGGLGGNGQQYRR